MLGISSEYSGELAYNQFICKHFEYLGAEMEDICVETSSDAIPFTYLYLFSIFSLSHLQTQL